MFKLIVSMQFLWSVHTEVRFASFFSGRFITAIIVNPPERRLAKRTSVQWSISFILKRIYHFLLAWSNIYHGNTLLAKIIGAVQYINKNMDIWTKIFPMISKKKDSNPAWFVFLTWPLSNNRTKCQSCGQKTLLNWLQKATIKGLNGSKLDFLI